jgi:diaminopimelate decarboxylase
MVEEGLGLDVAGGGEISPPSAGVDPAKVVLHGNARRRRDRHGRRAQLGLVVVDNSDDVDRLVAGAVP